MKTIIHSVIGATVLVAATATPAAAEICLPLLGCVLGGGGGGGGAPQAPEIDVAQGFAALAFLGCAVFLLREKFLRERTQAN